MSDHITNRLSPFDLDAAAELAARAGIVVRGERRERDDRGASDLDALWIDLGGEAGGA